jgi:hypothetical protein
MKYIRIIVLLIFLPIILKGQYLKRMNVGLNYNYSYGKNTNTKINYSSILVNLSWVHNPYLSFNVHSSISTSGNYKIDYTQDYKQYLYNTYGYDPNGSGYISDYNLYPDSLKLSKKLFAGVIGIGTTITFRPYKIISVYFPINLDYYTVHKERYHVQTFSGFERMSQSFNSNAIALNLGFGIKIKCSERIHFIPIEISRSKFFSHKVFENFTGSLNKIQFGIIYSFLDIKK